ncbi:hypothetical protein PMG11_07951 [Penicillium brasilianum]|uniref:Uncharacterized protein n=1 Tax=Penicillium brasilianum TaxID=104259 RepID=A0A0F7TR96_PENBI|nr:hypothetical protein PMG11_07951 [Penicillium brasilianum]
MRTRMCPDDVAWEQAEDIADCIGTEFAILKKGSYNISLRLKDKNAATIICLSQPGAFFFPEEKVVNEVAIMRFLTDKTSIPIPFVHYSGTKNESPLGLSPFIIMDYIEHETKMYDAQNTPGCPIDERGILDPAINKDRLEMLYGQLAGILLQLFTPSLLRIGSLSQIDDFTYEVTRRPFLPDLHTTFTTASSYFEALADLNIKHLIHQRNDSVESADDCRRKFVARRLFRKLAKDKKLTNPLLDEGPFKVWCDNLRPANVLLHENLKIAGVVDWEFTYAAPAEFSYPEYWPEGLDDWTRVFGYRLKTFLKVMKGHEDSAIQMGRLKEDQRLSVPMYQSWESGIFWVIYAALHSFAFDVIYWQKIDPRFFGPSEKPEEAWKERLDLLDEKEKYDMEQLVARKLEEMKTRILAWDPDE